MLFADSRLMNFIWMIIAQNVVSAAESPGTEESCPVRMIFRMLTAVDASTIVSGSALTKMFWLSTSTMSMQKRKLMYCMTP